MKCELCEGVALYQVGKKGYCKQHKAEAWAAEAKNNKQWHKNKVKEETFDKLKQVKWDRTF